MIGWKASRQSERNYRSFSHDVTAAINESVAMFVYKKIMLELNSFQMLELSFILGKLQIADHVTENALY